MLKKKNCGRVFIFLSFCKIKYLKSRLFLFISRFDSVVNWGRTKQRVNMFRSFKIIYSLTVFILKFEPWMIQLLQLTVLSIQLSYFCLYWYVHKKLIKRHKRLVPLSNLQATLHVGGHGERLTQCREVRVKTFKSMPMQVDGEPCRLRPSKININFRNQANMIVKPKRRGSMPIANEYVLSLFIPFVLLCHAAAWKQIFLIVCWCYSSLQNSYEKLSSSHNVCVKLTFWDNTQNCLSLYFWHLSETCWPFC